MPKILIVEDDKFLRELIKRKLKESGFETSTAADGEEGLASMKEAKPDLVLLDLIMPGLDGFEVLKKIQGDPSLSAVPVVILSNLGQQDDIDKARGLGAVDFLVKAHFTPSEILEKVNTVLKQKA